MFSALKGRNAKQRYVDVGEMSGNGERVGAVMLFCVDIIAERDGMGVSEGDLGVIERIEDFFLKRNGWMNE